MSARLNEDTLARINQDNREVSRRCSSDHIAGILFMPRAIGDDEFAFLCGEEAIGDVNRNALFAFGGQPIHQQRKVNVLTLGAHALGIGLQRRQLIFKDHF